MREVIRCSSPEPPALASAAAVQRNRAQREVIVGVVGHCNAGRAVLSPLHRCGAVRKCVKSIGGFCGVFVAFFVTQEQTSWCSKTPATGCDSTCINNGTRALNTYPLNRGTAYSIATAATAALTTGLRPSSSHSFINHIILGIVHASALIVRAVNKGCRINEVFTKL